MAETWDLARLTQEWTARGLDRRDLMKMIAAGAGGAALATLLGVSPDRAVAASAKQASDTPVSIRWDAPVFLNPLFSTSGSEQQIERLMFGALVKMSDALVPTPDLAETVDVSDDASVYTFKLHEGITFNDGTPLTSADVQFTLERAIDTRTGSYWKGRLVGIKGAADYADQKADSIVGIETPDDLTIILTMEKPNSAFLINLCNFAGLGILPKHILEGVPPEAMQEDPFTLAPTVTAGAFSFTKFEVDQYLEVARNDSYFGAAPALDRMFLKIVTPDVGIAQLETGEIDLMSLPISEKERVSTLDGITVVSVPSPSMSFLALNMSSPALQNKGMRQAMMQAIDRAGILAQVYQGEGEITNSPIFGPEWMGVPEGLNEYAYDVDAAKAALDASGWDTSQEVSMLVVVPASKEDEAAAAIIQEQLKQAGITLNILNIDSAELARRVIQGNDYDIMYGGGGVFRADPSISATYFLTQNFTPAGGNYSHYSNPQIDDLYPQGSAVKDTEERKAVYTQIAQILNDELPWIYLWSPNSVYAFRNRLQGFAAPSYTNNKFWNAETWSVTE